MTNLSSAALRDALHQIDPYAFEQVVARIWELQGYETTVSSGSRDRGIDIVAETTSPVDQTVLIQAKRYAEGNKIGSQAVRNYATLHQQEPDADAIIIVTTSSFTTEAERLASDLQVKTVDGEALRSIINESDDEQLAALLESPIDEGKDTDTTAPAESENTTPESEIPTEQIEFTIESAQSEPTVAVTQGSKRVTNPVDRIAEAFEQCYDEGLQFVKVGNRQNDAFVDYINEFEKETTTKGSAPEETRSEHGSRKVLFNFSKVSEREPAKEVHDEMTTVFGFELVSPQQWDAVADADYFMLRKTFPADRSYDYRRDALLAVKILYELYDTTPEAVEILEIAP